jgi:outer membrane protein insertion porin family
MVALRFRLIAGCLAMLAVLAAACLPLCAQTQFPPSTGILPPPTGNPQSSDVLVQQVRVEGNYTTPVAKLPQLRTRVGQPFDPVIVKEDVRTLAGSRKFLDVKSQFQPVPGGMAVIFQVVERPTIAEPVTFVGNQGIRTQTLRKKAELEKGAPLDPYAVEEARRRVEQYYREQGYNHIQITTIEGNKPNDHNVVFMVDEGQSQRVLWTSFEGNTFEGDARLRLQVKTKPGILWLFGGKVDRKKIDDDVNSVTAYYRSFGFFQARVSPVLDYNESKNWLSLKFVINEGPRYNVRNVAFLGNEKFKNEELNKNLEQISGKPFNQLALNRDKTAIADVYGEHGFIFADIQPENHLSADKPEVDIIYNISEGKRYRVGQVNINIAGDNPHTNHAVILNRMSVRPGDIVNTKKLREDERRIKFASVFNTDPSKGETPKITFDKPDGLKDEAVAKRPGGGKSGSSDSGGDYRSQSPEGGFRVQGSGFGGGGENYRAQSPDIEDIDLVLKMDAAGNTFWVASPAAPRPGQPGVVARFQSPGYANAVQPVAAADSNWSGYNNSSPATNQAFSNWGISPQPSSGSSYLPRSAQPIPASNATSPYPPTYPSSNSSYPAPSAGAAPYAASPYSNAAYPSQQVPARSSAFQQNPPGADPFVNQAPAPAYNSAPAYSNPPAYNNQPIAPQPAYNAPPPATQPIYGAQPGAVQPGYGAPAYGAPPTSSQPGYVVNQQGPVYETPPPYVAAPPAQSGGVFAPPPVPGLGPDDLGYVQPDPTVNLNVGAGETQTGRLMIGVGVNSDAGLVGNFVIDEQNFDIMRLPRSWEDVSDGTAWRGGGQRLRLEANPGTLVQRYAATFQEPYLFNSPVQFAVSGFYFTRIYQDWSEGRVGGNVKLGYLFTPDFSGHVGFDGERVNIYNPHRTVPNPTPPPPLLVTPELARALGQNDRYDFNVGAALDTRDSPFLPTQGHLVSVDFDEVVGTFQYPRVTVEGRQYFLLRQRADQSGRHVLAIGGVVGVTGNDTPIYDNFFAGGFSSLRGFAFRGASPVVNQVQVGGQFEALGTVEYMFPITADDALRGVVFCDFGTVEQKIAITGNQFRAAPGVGLRITVPAMGPAPIALDLAFPVANAPGDQIQNFAFFVGLAR